MQFDMCHASTPAALWEPAFVLASLAWAAVLAHLLCLGGNTDRPNWKLVALCVLASPIAANFLAPVAAFPSESSCSLTYVGPGIWMAVPLAIPFIALRLLQPSADTAAIAARAITLMVCFHGWWTLSAFREDVGREVGSTNLVGLEAKVAPAPWVALVGAALVLLTHIVMARGAAPSGWRAWAAARLQLLIAGVALVFELRFASMVMIFENAEPAPLVTPLAIAIAAIGVQAWRRLLAQKAGAP